MEIKVGNILMNKNIGDPLIFWQVKSIDKDLQGNTMLHVYPKAKPSRVDIFPLLFVDKYFILVDEITAGILFGKEETKNTSDSK